MTKNNGMAREIVMRDMMSKVINTIGTVFLWIAFAFAYGGIGVITGLMIAAQLNNYWHALAFGLGALGAAAGLLMAVNITNPKY